MVLELSGKGPFCKKAVLQYIGKDGAGVAGTIL